MPPLPISQIFIGDVLELLIIDVMTLIQIVTQFLVRCHRERNDTVRVEGFTISLDDTELVRIRTSGIRSAGGTDLYQWLVPTRTF